MIEEIKEILNRLERIDHKEYSGGFEFADSGSFGEDCRCFEERKKLANYITNLQKENDNYKQRNEKAVEYIKNTTLYGFRSEKTLLTNYLDDLLNILDGGDE